MKVVQIPNYHIFVRDLQLEWRKGDRQEALSLTVELNIDAPPDFTSDRYKFVTCYDRVVQGAKSKASSGGFKSLEALGTDIAIHCLDDHRVERVSIALEANDQSASGAGGCTIVRHRSGTREVS